MRRIFAAVTVLAFAAPASAMAGSGLVGHVHKAGAEGGAAQPMQLTLVFVRQGYAYRVRSGTDGAYRIVLPPGIYRVGTIPRVGVSLLRIRPFAVKVRAGHVDRLDFLVSTGIP